jgi:Raf kinase inhibitor-like YbhB/YbcL family protein
MHFFESMMGSALRGVRSDFSKLAYFDEGLNDAFDNIKVDCLPINDYRRLESRFTVDGEAEFPPIVWGALPAGTEELLLIVQDTDAPSFEPLIHLILAGIPARLNDLSNEDIIGARQDKNDMVLGRNSVGKIDYMPPAPPKKHGMHRYYFQLFALDKPLGLRKGAMMFEAIAAMSGHVLGKGITMVTYERK